MKLPIPTSLVDPPHMTQFHHGYDDVSYYGITLSMEICHLILGILSPFSARPTCQEAGRFTAGDGKPKYWLSHIYS